MTTPSNAPPSQADLHDLAERLREKVRVLNNIADATNRATYEHYRLVGKAQGVNLALSFVEEVLRDPR